MFLGRYDFTGDPAELTSRYDELMAQIPAENIQFHSCVVRDTGITLYDSCPTAEVFASFSTSPEFLALVRESGLPDPVVTPLGEVHVARVGRAFFG